MAHLAAVLEGWGALLRTLRTLYEPASRFHLATAVYSGTFNNRSPAHHENPRVWFLVSLRTIMMPLDSVVFEDVC